MVLRASDTIQTLLLTPLYVCVSSQDVPKEDLEAILDYMYAGTVKVAHSSLASLLHTAEGLQVKGLIIPDHFRGTPSASKWLWFFEAFLYH